MPGQPVLFVQQGGQRLVDQEAQSYVQQALAEGEGHVEHQQAVEQSVGGGDLRNGTQNGLVRTDPGASRTP